MKNVKKHNTYIFSNTEKKILEINLRDLKKKYF
jgi:hypothetical protein